MTIMPPLYVENCPNYFTNLTINLFVLLPIESIKPKFCRKSLMSTRAIFHDMIGDRTTGVRVKENYIE